ncbi:DUF4233 domain-containing protein [Micropruina sonneratiae]|uniref:DUF4233 domain-containing protein n=1 Tax=Micropruina sonneratiae TaxID=2986940 RepID=UPI002227ABEF|nr:DUF4233 domain-containing protein [Micropruina sp. KQZ13P-5]MCW3158323.1 DUF4233 domain-containing protein [Micropruina sp. KQZ13P-5]
MSLLPTNPMNKVLMAILLFEAICCGLAIPGMIQVADAPLGQALGLGGAAMALCLVAAGLMRRRIGWVLAWLAQLACVALGFAVDMMFAVGGMFLLLFVITFVLGRRLEATRTAG